MPRADPHSSGTTGAPKGICCPHRGAVHSYHHRLVRFPYSEGDREACHVFFVWELLRPLLGGMKSAGGVAVPLYVIPDDHIYDPNRWRDHAHVGLRLTAGGRRPVLVGTIIVGSHG